jgi:hypothetical protein
MEIQKNPKKNVGFFLTILPEILPDPFSPGWSHQPGLKSPPAFCTRPKPRGGPLVPVCEQPGLKKGGFSPALLVLVGQPGLKPFFLLVGEELEKVKGAAYFIADHAPRS